MKRILLTEKDFDELTSGKIVRKNNTEIILQDIGYSTMIGKLQSKYLNLLLQANFRK